MKFLAITLLTVFTISCNATKDATTHKNNKIEIIEIAATKVPCTGVGPMECIQIKRENEASYSLFYDTIKGFSFEEGYQYTLKIMIEKLDLSTVPADASTNSYTLIEVLDKKLDPTRRLHDIWVVKGLNGEELKTTNSTNTPQITLEINTNEMKILGNDSCNNFFGNINNLKFDKISFSQIGSTKKLCLNMEIPNSFYNALNKVATFELKNLNLYFKDKEGKVIITLLKVD